MAADPRKRQKKLERRSAKRKAKHHHLVREKSAGLPQRLTAAAGFPVLHSWATYNLWEKGLGWVGLSRELPDGNVAFAVFLVDRYCLGVKDAMADIVSRYDYDTRIAHKMRSEFGSKDMSPAAACELVDAAVDYARSLGISPHPDYHRAKLIFGAINPAECSEQFEFGKDGKPLFIAGPYDSPQRCRQILANLERTCGPGGFHYVMPLEQDAELIGVDGTDEDADDLMEFQEE
jgi:hypothetical protein